MKNKEYIKPTVAVVSAFGAALMAASTTKPGLTGNVDDKDQQIGNGGDDNDGREGDAKETIFDLWEIDKG